MSCAYTALYREHNIEQIFASKSFQPNLNISSWSVHTDPCLGALSVSELIPVHSLEQGFFLSSLNLGLSPGIMLLEQWGSEGAVAPQIQCGSVSGLFLPMTYPGLGGGITSLML